MRGLTFHCSGMEPQHPVCYGAEASNCRFVAVSDAGPKTLLKKLRRPQSNDVSLRRVHNCPVRRQVCIYDIAIAQVNDCRSGV
jgi:hypothetical protein